MSSTTEIDVDALEEEAVTALLTAVFLVEKGMEILVGYDAVTGGIYLVQEGEEPGSVHFSDELLGDLADPTRRIVLHHNHPSGTSLSTTDLRQIGAFPGLHHLCVHTQDGAFYWAERIAAFNAWDVERLKHVSDNAFRTAIQNGTVDKRIAKSLYHHIMCLAFAAAGFIRYGADLSPVDDAAYVSSQKGVAARVAEIQAGL